MGLIDFRPFFRVTADGEDITSTLASRLVSLTLTDAAGVKSDQLQFTLSDTSHFAKLAEPSAGAEIKVWLGYAFQLKYMGLFIADTVEVRGPPDQMTVTAFASLNGNSSSGKTALTDQKKRSWPSGTTIGDMVKTVAREHGLQEAVSKSLDGIALPHIDQIDESDINLLSRVARGHDAIAKPGDGRVVMAKRGESLTATGRAMPVLSLTPSKVSSWLYSNSVRETVGSVITVFQDLGAGRPQECRAGDGEPVIRIRRRHPNQEAAQRAADAELMRLARAGRSFFVSSKGNPDVMAEGKLIAAGFRPYVDGTWLITQATHILDSGGYRTTVDAEPMN